jgi:hypothetical protein
MALTIIEHHYWQSLYRRPGTYLYLLAKQNGKVKNQKQSEIIMQGWVSKYNSGMIIQEARHLTLTIFFHCPHWLSR